MAEAGRSVKIMKSFRHTKATWPVPLEELIARRDEQSKRHEKFSIVSTVILFSVLFGNIPLVRWLERDGEPDAWIWVLMLVSLFTFLFGNIFVLNWWAKKSMREFDLQCPKCKKFIDYKKLMPIAVATGHCCSCGAQLVSDHPSKA